MRKKEAPQTVASRRNARHEYEIIDTWEAGLVLSGSEVKSLRAGKASLREGYVVDDRQELWLINVHIDEYPQAGLRNHAPYGRRKLLLHRRQIEEIISQMREKGRTCIPLRMYFNDRGRCKVQIATVVGKKLYDKRHDLKEKQLNREMDRIKKERNVPRH